MQTDTYVSPSVLPRPNLVLMPYTDQCRLHRKLFQVTFESRTMLDSYRPLQRRYVDILLADLVRDPEGFIAHLKRCAVLRIELPISTQFTLNIQLDMPVP